MFPLNFLKIVGTFSLIYFVTCMFKVNFDACKIPEQNMNSLIYFGILYYQFKLQCLELYNFI